MFNTPYQKPKTVSGIQLADYFAANGVVHQSNYSVDRAQNYIVYGFEDCQSYESKKKFCDENKTHAGRSAWLGIGNGGLYLVSFRAENPSEEKLTPCVYEEPKSGRDAVKEERTKEKEEKKKWGHARTIESKNKILSVITDTPQTAEAVIAACELSGATVYKLLAKLVEFGEITLLVGTKEGAPANGRHYRTKVENEQ